jgi:hypothetical protein
MSLHSTFEVTLLLFDAARRLRAQLLDDRDRLAKRLRRIRETI